MAVDPADVPALIERLGTDATLLHDIVHGDADKVVMTEGGPVPSISRRLADPAIKGDSAYEVAVAEGFVGTEAEWLAALKGEEGNAGPLLWTVAATAAGNLTVGPEHLNQFVPVATAALVTATLPKAAPVGFSLWLSQEGAGQIDVVVEAGGSLQSILGMHKSAGRYAVIGCMCIGNADGASAVWRISGDLIG